MFTTTSEELPGYDLQTLNIWAPPAQTTQFTKYAYIWRSDAACSRLEPKIRMIDKESIKRTSLLQTTTYDASSYEDKDLLNLSEYQCEGQLLWIPLERDKLCDHIRCCQTNLHAMMELMIDNLCVFMGY